MIGYTAEYQAGEISDNNKELLEAGWFELRNLPPFPTKPSTARQIIEWFVKEFS